MAVPSQEDARSVATKEVRMAQEIGLLSVFDSGRLKGPPPFWLIVVKWLLLVPRLVILLALGLALMVTSILSLLAVLLTAKFPQNNFDCRTRMLRWAWRTGFYSLEEFTYRNWDNIDWGSTLEVYKNGEESGRRFPAGTWFLDFLARDVDTDELVVIQLKRGENSDSTVGELLRYIAYIKEKVAADGQRVRGIIVTKKVDPALAYAVMDLPFVQMRTYEVDFQLRLRAFLGVVQPTPPKSEEPLPEKEPAASKAA